MKSKRFWYLDAPIEFASLTRITKNSVGSLLSFADASSWGRLSISAIRNSRFKALLRPRPCWLLCSYNTNIVLPVAHVVIMKGKADSTQATKSPLKKTSQITDTDHNHDASFIFLNHHTIPYPSPYIFTIILSPIAPYPAPPSPLELIN